MSQEFTQNGPVLANTYLSHRWLKAYLKWRMPADHWAEVNHDLTLFGAQCSGPYFELARQAERERPEHIPFTPWGQRCDDIRVSAAWLELQNISAREGLVSLGYQRRQREYSRLYQFSKLYLFHPSSAFFTCPLAMGDGAAKVLELYGREPVHREAFRRLTSREPSEFWTSGQWMTEKTGGSDVSGTSTVARLDAEGHARLSGIKWFSSATTSGMALALARWEGAAEGSRGLTLFLVPMRLPDGRLNGVEILRLKDKLGTWALPTAELRLNGALAHAVGERDHGVKTVTAMLNITRLYNSICSVGQMTRALDLMRDYSSKRKVFGAPLIEQPLHLTTFAQEQAKLLAGFVLTMEMVTLLGKDECGVADTKEQDLLRLFTPIAKLFTAKTSIQVASEVIEGFGGVGYVEDSGIPVHLRDAQVFSIWEGATNVLSLDLIRVVQKTSALTSFQVDVTERLKRVRSNEVGAVAKRFAGRWHELERSVARWVEAEALGQAASARDLAFNLGWYYAFALLLSWADGEKGANQKLLLAWLHEIEGLLGRFEVKSADHCQNSRQAFCDQLEA